MNTTGKETQEQLDQAPCRGLCLSDFSCSLSSVIFWGYNNRTKYDYVPFGGTIASTGSMKDDFAFRFSTKYLNDETALYYYGLRTYSPELGRWISRDPIGERGGLNVYGFVGNGPDNTIDPDGLLAYEHTATTVGFDRREILEGGAFLTGAFTGGSVPSLVQFDEWRDEVNYHKCRRCGYTCYTFAKDFFRVSTSQTLLDPVPDDPASAIIAATVNAHEGRRLQTRRNANRILAQAEQAIYALYYFGITKQECLGHLSANVTRIQLAAKNQWISYNDYNQGQINTIENGPNQQVFVFEDLGGQSVLKSFWYKQIWVPGQTSFTMPSVRENENCPYD